MTPGSFQFPSQYWASNPPRVPVSSWSVQVLGPSPWRAGQISGSCTLGGDSVDMAFLPVPVKVVTLRLCVHFWISLGTLMEQLQSFMVALWSSVTPRSPCSKGFPSWPVPDLSNDIRVVGSSLVSRFHLLDGERPVKRFRITGKRTIGKCLIDISGELPTPKRWKRLILHGSGHPRDENGLPPDLFPRVGVS